jgi:hypothetical protein
MKTKNIIKRLTLTVFGIIIIQNTFSQENYLPAYIISLKGDTLHGFIDYRNWDINPDKINFKEKSEGSVISYSPSDIKGFGVLDEIYESAKVNKEISPKDINNLEFNPELKITIDTVFLQSVIIGSKCLYSYKLNSENELFYFKQDTSYELLIFKKYLKIQDGKNIIKENNKYLGQLLLYLQDCPKIQSKLKTTKYNKKSLEKLFLFYYKCSQSNIKFSKKTEKLISEIGLLAGLSTTTLKFKGDEQFQNLIIPNFQPSINFSGGLSFDIILPRNQGKWSISNELIYSAYSAKNHFEEYVNENDYTIIDATAGYSYLKMNNMLRFKYPIGNLSVYINAGISNGYAINEKNSSVKVLKLYAPETTTEDKAIQSTRLYEQGIVLGLGTRYKKYSLEIRCEKGNGMSAYSLLNSVTTRYYFMLGYRF